MTRAQATLMSVMLGAVFTLAAYTDTLFVAAAVVIAQLMVAAAPAPSDERGRRIACPRFGPALAAALVATAVTVFPDLWIGASGTTTGSIGFISSGLMSGAVPGMTVGLLGALLGQMLRKDGRPSLVLSLSYATALCMFAVLLVGWIGASQSLGGAPLVALGSIAVGVALFVWLVPGGRAVVGIAAVVAASAATGLSTLYLSGPANMGLIFGATVGAGIGLFAILGQVLGRAWSLAPGHSAAGWGFAGAMSLALSAPVVFISSQFLGTGLGL